MNAQEVKKVVFLAFHFLIFNGYTSFTPTNAGKAEGMRLSYAEKNAQNPIENSWPTPKPACEPRGGKAKE